MVSKTTPNIFGGIAGAEDGLTLRTGPFAGAWSDGSNGSENVLVDSGAWRHYFNDAIIPRLRDKLGCAAQNHNHRWRTTGRRCARTAQSVASSSTTKGMRRLAQLSFLVVPSLGHNLFSVKQAARNGVVSTFDMDNPRHWR